MVMTENVLFNDRKQEREKKNQASDLKKIDILLERYNGENQEKDSTFQR